MSQITRRNFVKILGGTAAVSALGFPGIAAAAGKKQVVIVGGGVGGATAAKYIRRADPSIEVTLIEPNKDYYTCFMSNEVLSGERSLDKVTTQGGQSFSYDRAIVAPGISFRWGAIEGYDMAASQQMPHAWKAGPQTALLRKQLEAMADGGTVMIVPPPNPFRCPPGPYERACQIAHYLQQHKPKSKILIIDPKDSFSKQGLFTQAWDRHYKGMIEWRKGADTGGGIKSVDVKAGSVATDFDTYKPAVVNIIPAQKAGEIAEVAGLTDDSGWCPIEGKTFESTLQKGIHVVGDAAVQDPLPKSAYAANSEAKVVAAAVVDLLNDREPGTPSWVNTCYSLVAPDDGISVAMVYKLGPDGKVAKVEGSGGLTPMDSSPEDRKREVAYAYSWFENITHDTFD
jgi:sulfide dehydrogenase [flavocytochrome c] flavoprotein subunit